jgi:hypothetical protein
VRGGCRKTAKQTGVVQFAGYIGQVNSPVFFNLFLSKYEMREKKERAVCFFVRILPTLIFLSSGEFSRHTLNGKGKREESFSGSFFKMDPNYLKISEKIEFSTPPSS